MQTNAKVLAALEAAYIKFGDFRMDWDGRHTADGQMLLSSMRDAISEARNIEPQEVQDTLGTALARLEAA